MAEAARTYRATAIVLRRINIGETDRVVTLYTRERGKLSGIAKGARKHLSKLAGATELFTYGRYFLGVGRELDVITQAEVKESFPGIRRDLKRIAHATYISELVNSMVEEREANYDLFDTLLSSLYMLEGGVDPEIVARHFELQMMSLMGYRPELDTCLRCDKQPSDEEIAFSPSLGGRVCGECGPLPDDVIYLSNDTLDVMRFLLSAEPQALKDLHLPPDVKEELFRAIRWYVRYRLDKDVKSSEFIQALAAVGTGEELQAEE
ncbi:MAG TPA: DNA repair protein RecO [Armatimonadota bacterium]|nr:DNA repair protein RecO [Armatimonadota bacterium]